MGLGVPWTARLDTVPRMRERSGWTARPFAHRLRLQSGFVSFRVVRGPSSRSFQFEQAALRNER
jgi:hypothetical protein